jgi:hypothetical protein
MNFALITEGVSEYRIIKHILNKYFKEQNPDINQIQPKVVNDKQETVGGWNEVLKYCERKELNEIFIENDYLIIQIDSDMSNTIPFNVSHTKIDPATASNVNKTFNELYEDITIKLQSLINVDVLDAHGHKIIFAVCIHTIECWLLPIFFSNHHKSDTQNCINTLNIELRKKNIHIISKGNKNSPLSIITYDLILKNWKKQQDIIDSSKHNIGFFNFINSLSLILPANQPI